MKYNQSILNNQKFLNENFDHNLSVIQKWMKYKRNPSIVKNGDLDKASTEFYEEIWKDNGMCSCSDTMTSVLTTFKEFITFLGFDWKQNGHGKITLLNFLESNDYENYYKLTKVKYFALFEEFVELATSPCNMLPVPKYFNAGRAGRFATWDYWDLTLEKLYEWFNAKKDDDYKGQLQVLDLLFTYANNKNKINAVNNTQEWLASFDSWNDFIETYFLQSFVDEKNGKPKKMWSTHSFEMPLPTDVLSNLTDEKKTKHIESNFVEFFTNYNKALKERSELLRKRKS